MRRATNILDTVSAEPLVKFVEMREEVCILAARNPNYNLGAWKEASLGTGQQIHRYKHHTEIALLPEERVLSCVLPDATSTSLGGWLD